MPSMKSRMFVFMLQHMHLLQGRLKRRAMITWDTSIEEFRQSASRGSKAFGKLPEGLAMEPVQIGEMYAEWIEPEGAARDRAILYCHGGGYVSGDCQSHRTHVAKFVTNSGIPALLFDYRLAPEHPFPAAMEDALAAYRHLLDDGIAPERIVFAGDSAGGGLCLALLLAARDEGLPLPGGAVGISPWTDLKCSSESRAARKKLDPLSPGEAWTVFGHYYAGDADRENPWISPLYGDLAGLPPVLVVSGDHDALFEDSPRFVDKAKAAGVDATLHVGEGLFHCYPVCAPFFPEAQQAMDKICAFFEAHTAAQPALAETA